MWQYLYSNLLLVFSCLRCTLRNNTRVHLQMFLSAHMLRKQPMMEVCSYVWSVTIWGKANHHTILNINTTDWYQKFIRESLMNFSLLWIFADMHVDGRNSMFIISVLWNGTVASPIIHLYSVDCFVMSDVKWHLNGNSETHIKLHLLNVWVIWKYSA